MKKALIYSYCQQTSFVKLIAICIMNLVFVANTVLESIDILMLFRDHVV